MVNPASHSNSSVPPGSSGPQRIHSAKTGKMQSGGHQVYLMQTSDTPGLQTGLPSLVPSGKQADALKKHTFSYVKAETMPKIASAFKRFIV